MASSNHYNYSMDLAGIILLVVRMSLNYVVPKIVISAGYIHTNLVDVHCHN